MAYYCVQGAEVPRSCPGRFAVHMQAQLAETCVTRDVTAYHILTAVKPDSCFAHQTTALATS